MLTATDLNGVMGMMPAFATDNAADLRATDTVGLDNLRDGVNRIIADGIDVIATTGSFGEFHTLLDAEFKTLVHGTVEAVNKRVPLFIGCTSLHSREVVQKMEVIRDSGADGALIGVPFYFPATVDNAVRFYRDIAEMFPTVAIMLYHNPALHNVTIPVDAVRTLCQLPNVVAMKDSHRDTLAFMRLMDGTRGRLSVFVHQSQYYPFSELGAAGCWSIDAWLGPWPVLALRNAVRAGDAARAKEIIFDIMATSTAPVNLSWRETASKIAQGFAGYCRPGPLRPPFVEIPENVLQAQKKRAEAWQALCAKYRPRVQEAVTA